MGLDLPFIELSKFTGINNVDAPLSLASTELQQADNVINLKDGSLLGREGFTLKLSGTPKSLWANHAGTECYFMQNGELRSLHTSLTSSTLVASGFKDLPMSFCEGHLGVPAIWCASETSIGVIINGRYQGSFSLPLDIDKDYPVPGHLVAFYKNVLYVASGSNIYFSDAAMPWQFDFENNVIRMQGKVTLMAPVSDGMFVGDGMTHFWAGSGPSEFIDQIKADYNPILYTDRRINREAVGVEDGLVDVWWTSEKGVCIGSNGGAFKNLTAKKVITPGGSFGASLYQQSDNIHRFITTIH